MAIDVTWGNEEQTLIHVTFTGSWTWYEFYAAAGTISQHMESVSHPVDIVLDMQNSVPVPPDLMLHMQRVEFYSLLNGVAIVVQKDAARQTLAERITALLQHNITRKVVYANDLYEAQMLITRQPA